MTRSGERNDLVEEARASYVRADDPDGDAPRTAHGSHLAIIEDAAHALSDADADEASLWATTARCAASLARGTGMVEASRGYGEMQVTAVDDVDSSARQLARSLLVGRAVVRGRVHPEVAESRQRRRFTVGDARDAAAPLGPLGATFVARFPRHCFMVVPILEGDVLLGVLTLCRQGSDAPFTDAEWSVAQALANVASLAVRQARGRTAALAAREDAEQLATLMAHLQAATAALAESTTLEEAIAATVREGLAAFGPFVGRASIYFDGGDDMAFAFCQAGSARAEVTRLRDDTASVWLPGTAARFATSPEEVSAKLPSSLLAELDARASAAMWLPLNVKGRALGAVAVLFARARAFSERDRRFAETLAQQCAQAIDRGMLLDSALKSNARTSFLAGAGALLGTSLDYDAVLRHVANLAVPRLADWCAIDVIEGEGRRRVAVTRHELPSPEWGRVLEAHFVPVEGAPRGIQSVLSTGTPELYREISDEDRSAWGLTDEQVAALASVPMRSLVIVPLIAHGTPLGSITLASTDGERIYDHADLDCALELARRAALSVENARLFRDRQTAVDVRDDFLAAAGHELRTPLTALLMQVQGLGRAVSRGQDLADAGGRLDRVIASARRLDRLINELLDVSRITAGRLRLDPERFDLVGLAREVVENFADITEKSSTPIDVVAAEVPLFGVWDRSRIEQVVTNLVGNAVKYGTGKRVEVRVRRDTAHAVVEVKDRGIGIEPEQKARIFERFERAVTSRDFGGLGLGLWIVRQIVDAIGGTIEVQSTHGAGSTFTVRLPLPSDEGGTVE